MKIEIDVPDEGELQREISLIATRCIKNVNWLRDKIERKVNHVALDYVESLDIAGMVRAHIDTKIQSVIENVVAGQVRHIVKLAVDKELAIARELVTP